MIRPNLSRPLASILLLLGTVPPLSLPAFADPPPWAPAYGYREKQHGHGHGDNDAPVTVAPAPVVVAPAPVYASPAPAAVAPSAMPFGLGQNTCHRDLIGAALGGAAGGLVGSNIGKGSGRTLATVGGVLAGIFVGGAIGRSMDEADQACIGAALQYTPDRQTVVWQGPEQQGYWVTPLRSYESRGRYCRDYESRALIGGRVQVVTSRACRGADGAWTMAN